MLPIKIMEKLIEYLILPINTIGSIYADFYPHKWFVIYRKKFIREKTIIFILFLNKKKKKY